MKKIKSMIIFILFHTLFLTGCWNYREIDELGIVSGIAVDKTDDKFRLTFEIINQKGGGTEAKMQAEVGDFEGETFFDAIRNARAITGKRLYFSHSKVVIISQEQARQGVRPAVDLINRDAEMRSDIYVLISRNKTATEILEAETNIYTGIALKLADTIKGGRDIGKYMAVPLWMFLNDLSSEGTSAVLPMVRTIRNKDKLLTEIEGMALFSGDKMIGQLDGEETKALLWVKDKMKGGLISLKNAAKTGTDVTLEIKDSKTKQKTMVSPKGDLAIEVNVKTSVVIAELSDSTNFIGKEGREELEKVAEDRIKEEIEEVIKTVQKTYKVDVFGFSGTLERQMPQVWEEIKPNWKETFSKLDTRINVEIEIEGSSLTSKPIKVGG